MENGQMKRSKLFLRAGIFLLVLLFMFSGFTLSSCRNTTIGGDPEGVIRAWLDAWSKKDLDTMLNMTAEPFKKEVEFFYGNEFKHYEKLNYDDLKIQVIKEGPQNAEVKTEFVAVQESGTDPIFGGQSMVTKSAVRHTFELIRQDDRWLIKSVKREPAS